MSHNRFAFFTWLYAFTLIASLVYPSGALATVIDTNPEPAHRVLPLPAARPAAPQANTFGSSVELVSQMGGGSYTVAVQGNIAYLGMGARLVLLDISNPAQPAFLSQTDFLDMILWRLVPEGNLLFALKQGVVPRNQYSGAGVMIFDVSDPSSPEQVSFFPWYDMVEDLVVSGDYAYFTTFFDGMQIIDIHDPSAPQWVGKYSIGSSSGLPTGLAVNGDLAYILFESAGLEIVNVADRAHPARLGGYSAVGEASDLAVSGDYAYLADYNVLQVIKISDPAHPVQWGATDYGESYTYDRLQVIGRYIYAIACGLAVIDILDPAHPQEVGRFPVTDCAEDLQMAPGAGAQLLAFLASPYTGLDILDASNPAALSQVGSYRELGAVGSLKIAGGYAYLSWGKEMRVLDTANPVAPRLLGVTNILGSLQTLSGNYAYFLTFYTDPDQNPVWGLRVVDVSNPGAPQEVGFLETPQHSGSMAVHTDTQGHTYAYITLGYNGLLIVNVTDPSHPALAGSLDTLGNTQGVAVAGPDAQGKTYAYIAAGANSLEIVDVTDPAHPSLAGQYSQIDPETVDVAVKGEVAYIIDLDWDMIEVIAVDVSDPGSPVKIGSDFAPGEPHSIEIVGDYAYLAQDWANLQILDISDPAAADWDFAYFRTPTFTYDVAVIGNFVYMGDWDGGLYIVWFGPSSTAEISASGGELSSNFDQVSYQFASGTFTDTVRVVHRPRYDPNLPRDSSLAPVGRSFEVRGILSGYLPVEPSLPYTVTISYSQDQVPPRLERALALYYWDGAAWVREPSTVLDIVNHQVVAHPDHFSLWAVMLAPKSIFLPLTLR